mmetsp:Transcript_53170/g.159131  ORF Transcript_53170/g.159131 Transcript_53170/m.159131 type:complete len:232 (-) Transcript_53170:1994-2689(-)
MRKSPWARISLLPSPPPLFPPPAAASPAEEDSPSSPSSPPFSANVSVRLGSNTELRRSSTASSARLISSNRRRWPERIAETSGPSTHSKRERYRACRSSISRRRGLASSSCFESRRCSSDWRSVPSGSTSGSGSPCWVGALSPSRSLRLFLFPLPFPPFSLEEGDGFLPPLALPSPTDDGPAPRSSLRKAAMRSAASSGQSPSFFVSSSDRNLGIAAPPLPSAAASPTRGH